METILYSSGIDSYLCREYLISHEHEIQCVYFNIKSKYSLYEIEKIYTLPFNVIIDESIDLSDIEQKDAYIPNRNFLLTLMAISKYSDIVWLGGTQSDRVNDNNQDVFDKLSEFYSNVHQRHIKISSPFWNVYKTDVVKWFQKRNSNSALELLENTFSCYHPLQKKQIINIGNHINRTAECLECSACFRKNVELYHIGLFRPFNNLKIVMKYENEFKNILKETLRSKISLDYIHKLKTI